MIKFEYFFLFIFLSCANDKDKLTMCKSNYIEYNVRLAKNEKFTYKQRSEFSRKSLEAIAQKPNDSSSRAKLFDICVILHNINDWKNYKKATNIVLKRSIESNDNKCISLAYSNLGTYYSYRSINDSAYYYFLKARKIYIKLNNISRLANIYLKIASSQRYACDYLNAEVSALQALKYSKMNNNKKIEYEALVILGIISKELLNYKEAHKYYNKALFIAENDHTLDKKNFYIEVCLNNMGYLYLKSGEYEKALSLYERSIKGIKYPIYYPELYTESLDNYAYCKFKLGNYSKLPHVYHMTTKIRDDFNVDQGRNFNKLFLAEYYLSKNDSVKAKISAFEALKISKEFNAPKDILEVFKLLISIEPNKASTYSQQYIKLNDSLQIAERKIRNKFARIAYETDEIVLQKDTAVKHKWIILIVAGSILLLLILLFIIKIQRAKQKELMFIQQQQKANENIYRLIQDQQIKINEARHLEKKRISQELHDGVMNKLTSTRLNLFILSKKRDDETINKCLTFINDIQSIEKEIRQVSHDLNSQIFSGNNSFSTLLESLFNQQREISNANLFTEIDTSIPWETMQSVIKMNLYRILQEAFQNCNKYAQATNIYVTISTGVGTLQIIINDDGLGFNDKKYRKGIGLKNMKDRVDAISGRIDILSQKRKGTTIIVNLPIK